MLGRFFQKEQDAEDDLDQAQADPRQAGTSQTNAERAADGNDDDESRLSFMQSDDDVTVDTAVTDDVLDMVKNNFLSGLQAESDDDASSQPPSPMEEGNGDLSLTPKEEDNSTSPAPGRWGRWGDRRASLEASHQAEQDEIAPAPDNSSAADVADTPRRRRWGWAGKADNENSQAVAAEDEMSQKEGDDQQLSDKDVADGDETPNEPPAEQTDSSSAVDVADTPRRRRWGWAGKADNENSQRGPADDESNQQESRDQQTSEKGSESAECISSNESASESNNTETPRRQKWGWGNKQAGMDDDASQSNDIATPDASKTKNEEDDEPENPVVSTIQSKYLGGWSRRGSNADQSDTDSQKSGSTPTEEAVTPRTAARRWGWGAKQQQQSEDFGEPEANDLASPPTEQQQADVEQSNGDSIDDSHSGEEQPPDVGDSAPQSNSDSDVSSGSDADYNLDSESESTTDDEPRSTKRFSWMSQSSNIGDVHDADRTNSDENSENDEDPSKATGKAERPSLAETKSDAGSWFGTSVASMFSTAETTAEATDPNEGGGWFGNGILSSVVSADDGGQAVDTEQAPSSNSVEKRDTDTKQRPDLARSSSWLGSVLGQEEQVVSGCSGQEPNNPEQSKSWLESVIGDATGNSSDPSGDTTKTAEGTDNVDRRGELKRSKSWLESLVDGDDEESAKEAENSNDRRENLTRSKSWIESLMGDSNETAQSDAEKSGAPGPQIHPEKKTPEGTEPQKDMGPYAIDSDHPAAEDESHRVHVETTVQSDYVQQTLLNARESNTDLSADDPSRCVSKRDHMSTDSQSNLSAYSATRLESERTEKERSPPPVQENELCESSTASVSEHDERSDQSSLDQETGGSTLKDPDPRGMDNLSETADSPPDDSKCHLHHTSKERQEFESDQENSRDLASGGPKLNAPSPSVSDEQSPGSCCLESESESLEETQVQAVLLTSNDRTKSDRQDLEPSQSNSVKEGAGDYESESESESSKDVSDQAALVPCTDRTKVDLPSSQPAADEECSGDYDLESESESSEDAPVAHVLNIGLSDDEQQRRPSTEPLPPNAHQIHSNKDDHSSSPANVTESVVHADANVESNDTISRNDSWLGSIIGDSTIVNSPIKKDDRPGIERSDSWLGSIMGESSGERSTENSEQVKESRPVVARSDSWLGSIMGEPENDGTPNPTTGVDQAKNQRPDLARSDSWLGSIMGESNDEPTSQKDISTEKDRPVVVRSDSWLASIMGEADGEPSPKTGELQAERPEIVRSDSWLGSIMGESNDGKPEEKHESTDDGPVVGKSESWLGSIMGEAVDEPAPKTSELQAERPGIVTSDSWLGSIMGESNDDKAEGKPTDDRPVVERSESWLGSIMGESSDDPAPKGDNAQTEDRQLGLARSDSWLGSIMGEPNDNKETPGDTAQEVESSSPAAEHERSDSVETEDNERQKSWLESVFGEEGEKCGEAPDSAEPEAPKTNPPDRRAGLQRSNSWLESVLAEGGDPTASDFKEEDVNRRGQLKKSKSWLEMMMNEEEEKVEADGDAESSGPKPPTTSNLRAELKRSQSWFESKEVTTAVEPAESDAKENVSDGLFYHEAEPEADETFGNNDGDTDEAGVCMSRFDGLRRLALFKALESQSFLKAPETVLKATETDRDRDGDKRLAIAKAILGEEIDRMDEASWTDEGVKMDLEVPDYLLEESGNHPESAEAQQDTQDTGTAQKSDVDVQTPPSNNETPEDNAIEEISGRQRWRKWFGGPKPKEEEELEPVHVEDDQLESSASEVSESDPSLSTGMLESDTIITESKVPAQNLEAEAQKVEVEAPDCNVSKESLAENEIGNRPTPGESSLDATAALIQTLTPEEVDLITTEVVSQLQQEKEGKEEGKDLPLPIPEPPAVPATSTRGRRKKGSIGALLEQIPSAGKTGRHGDEVSVGVMNLRRTPVRPNRDVVVPNLDENTLATSLKKHPWENALKETSKKSAFSNAKPDEEEELKKIEILGKADEFFGFRPNLSASELPTLNEDEESTRNSEESDVEEEEESEEDVDELAILNEKSDLEKALEEEPGLAADFDEMWDNVSCDEEIANEFERKKRKKNHEREKRRQKIEREKDDGSVATKRLRLFEKTDRSATQKQAKNGKTTKLSEELVEALQKVFNDGSENSLGSFSDEDTEEMIGVSGHNASCNSLYFDEKDDSESLPDSDRSESQAEEQDENANQEIKRSDGRSRPMINKALCEDEPEEQMNPPQNSTGKSKKQSKNSSKTATKKRTKRTETDASEVFMREISKLKQPKVLTIGSLRQEMIDRRGTTVNLLKKEYVTFRKKRNDRKDVSGEEEDQVRPLDFGALATRRSIAHTPADDIFGSTPKPKEESIGLAEKLSRWASKEGVSELDDLATVYDNPTTVTNMFGVVQQTSNKAPSLAPPLRVPATPGGGPRQYVGGGPMAGSPVKMKREASIRQTASVQSLSPSPATYKKPSARRDIRREPSAPPGSVASSNERVDMFSTFGGAESSVLPSINNDGSVEDFGLLAKSSDRDDDDDQSYFSTGSNRKKKGFQKGLGKNLKKLASKMPTLRTRGPNSGAGMMLSDNDW